jgi:acetyl esterase/lipase
MKNYLIIGLFMAIFPMLGMSQGTFIPLWPEGAIPYSKPHKEHIIYEKSRDKDSLLLVRNISVPGITAYLAPKEKNTGMSVVICPGGAYVVEAYDHEGIQIAQQLNEWGINAFVLRYRLPEDSMMTEKKWVPLTDALRAIQLVRNNAGKWGLNTHKVGIMGFSAGGHLAATVATHYGQRAADGFVPDEVRPDFAVLCYAVITMKEEFTHSYSRFRLLGSQPSYEDILEFSNETKVDANTPPTFLIHTADDWVPVENALQYAAACAKHDVPVECHILPKGVHGYGLAKGNADVGVWVEYLRRWLGGVR